MSDWKKVDSSAIRSYRYTPATGLLEVKFASSEINVYEYYNVPQEKIAEFEKSESKGKFFHKELKQYSVLSAF